MPRTIYIDTDNIVKTTKSIGKDIPRKAWERAKGPLGEMGKRVFRRYLPVGSRERMTLGIGKATRLRDSVRVQDKKNELRVFPGKKVYDTKGKGYWLGSILERGSPGGQVIKPINGKWLIFKHKGRWMYAKEVKRGTIPAQNFMEKVEKDAKANAPKIYEKELLRTIRDSVKTK